MWTNKLMVMAKATVLAIICTLTNGCNKEETISVPKHIAGTEWQQTTEEHTIRLVFDSDAQCIYSEKNENGVSEYSYTYEYHKPDIKLTPKDSEREVLTGYIEQCDPRSIAMRLFGADGQECFTAYCTTYWKL